MVKCPALERLAGCFVQHRDLSAMTAGRGSSTPSHWESPGTGFGSDSSGMSGQCRGIPVENVPEWLWQPFLGTGSAWHPQPHGHPHSLGTCWMAPWLPPAPPTMGCTHLLPPEPAPGCPPKMDAHPPGCPQIVGAPLPGCPPHIWITPPRGGHLYALPPSLPHTHPPGHLSHLDAPKSWVPPLLGCPTHLDAPPPSTCPSHLDAQLTPGCPPFLDNI